MSRVGANVIGYLHSENGVGEAARLLIASADAADVPHSEIVLTGPHRDLHPFAATSALEQPQAVNVVCVNADVFAPIADWIERSALCGRPTVGWWAWGWKCSPRRWP